MDGHKFPVGTEVKMIAPRGAIIPGGWGPINRGDVGVVKEHLARTRTSPAYYITFPNHKLFFTEEWCIDAVARDNAYHLRDLPLAGHDLSTKEHTFSL